MDLQELSTPAMVAAAASVAIPYLWWLRSASAKTSRPRLDLDRIPSPPEPSLLLGHVPVFTTQSNFVESLKDFAMRLGPIYKIRLGPECWIIVSDPHVAASLHPRDGSGLLAKTPLHRIFDHGMGGSLRTGEHGIFATADELRWKAVRKAVAPTFSPAAMRAHFPALLRAASVTTDRISAAVKAGREVDAESEAFGFTLDATFLGLFQMPVEASGHPGSLQVDLTRSMAEVTAWTYDPLTFWFRSSWLGSLLSRHVRDYNALHERLRATFLRMATKVHDMPEPDPSDVSLNACLRRAIDHKTGKPFTPQQLIPEVGTMVTGGFETTGTSIAWCLLAAAGWPEWQDRVVAELRQAGLAGPSAREPSYEELSGMAQLPVTAAFVNEAMRMWPVAGAGMVRMTTKPTKVGPYWVPPGVSVLCSIYNHHRLEASGWEAPSEFRPERWLAGEDMVNAPPRDPNNPLHASLEAARTDGLGTKPVRFMPFFIGPKTCIGQALGLFMVRMAVVRLLASFQVSLHPSMGSREEVLKRSWVALTLQPPKDLRLEFKVRG